MGFSWTQTAVDGTPARKQSPQSGNSGCVLQQLNDAFCFPVNLAADQLDELAFADFIDFIHIESETALVTAIHCR